MTVGIIDKCFSYSDFLLFKKSDKFGNRRFRLKPTAFQIAKLANKNLKAAKKRKIVIRKWSEFVRSHSLHSLKVDYFNSTAYPTFCKVLTVTWGHVTETVEPVGGKTRSIFCEY